MTHDCVIIGCGRGGRGSAGSHSIGYLHGHTYQKHAQCRIVGAVDLDPANLAAYQSAFTVPHGGADAAAVLAATKPQLVSICTYAGSHRQLVEAAIAAGARGIWCEKPFALTMDDAHAMVEACEQADVKLVVNYLRRDYAVFHRARDLIASGAIGEVSFLLAGIDGWEAMEWGCHWLDMFLMLQGDAVTPQWVFGQMRCDGSRRGYGHVMEQHGVTCIGYDSGARALLDGGKALRQDAAIRVIGSRGLLDIHQDGLLRVIADNGLHKERTASTVHRHLDDRGPADVVLERLLTWMDGGDEPPYSGRRALASTSCYLGAYESAARGDRVDLPMSSQNRFPLDVVAERQSTQNIPR